MQANVLHGGPDNRQATVLGREDVNLVGTLAYIAEETLDGIGGLNMPMHRCRERIKRQRVLFLLDQTSHRFGIAFVIFGGSRLPGGRVHPVSSVAAKSPRVQLEPQYALAWGLH